MPLSLDQFRTRLVASSLMTEGDVEGLLSSLTEVDQPADGEAFAKRLVRDGLLTAWQAKQVYRGKSKSLVLGNYVLLDKLGQGGMGMVFKAEHQVMKRIVAVKTLSPEISKSSTLVARFRREVQVAARLDHPNIVTAFDAANEGAIQYLVMQYVDGEDLSALVRRQGTLSVSKAIDCIRQAATGLQYAHEQGVIHRDIKPSNLLLDRSGTVKVLDMGLARFEGLDEKSSELTVTGAVMGTIDYMAPEQAEDTHQADARADIYSLGCSLFYLLTGQPTFGGNTAIKRILAHRESVIPSLTTYVNEATPQLNALFQEMVAKRPEDRIQTMKQVCERLEQLGTDHTTVRVKSIISEDSKLDDFLKSMNPESSTENDSAAQTQVTRVRSRTEGAKNSDSSDDFFDLKEDFATSAVPSKESKSKRLPNSPFNMKTIGVGLVAVIPLVMYLASISGNSGENEETTPVVTTPVVEPLGGSETPPESNSADSAASETSSVMATDPVTTGLYFDGEDDYAVAPGFQFDDDSAATIEVWMTCTIPRPAANPVMVLGRHWMAIFHVDSDWGVGKLNGDTTEMFMFPQGLQQNVRMHIAGVWDGQTARIFVNGEEPESRTPNGFPLGPTSSGLYIGGVPPELENSIGGARYFEGVIHQVRISNDALYPNNFTPAGILTKEANTTGLFHLNEGEGNEIQDLSGNNRHGTIHGAIWRSGE